MSATAESEVQGWWYLGMKRLVGSNESWGAGGNCRDSCRSAELEVNYSKV